MVSMLSVAIIATIFTVVFLGLSFYKFKPGKVTSFSMASSILVLLALSVRLFAAYNASGFTTDVNCFEYWGQLVNNVGMSKMYQQDVFIDYPPGYITVLWFVEKVARFFGVKGQTYDLLFCLPSILADLICGMVLLSIARKKLCESKALFVGAAYLFCPVTIIDSAQWGQVDGFCLMFLFLSIVCLYDGRYLACGVLYGISAICKPQMFVFIPVYLFYVLRRKDWKALFVGLGSGLAAMLLVALPYTTRCDYSWLVDKYKECMSGYNYYTVNAYNYWALRGMNWRGLPGSHMLLTILAPIVAVVVCGLFFFSKKKDVVFAGPVILMTIVFSFGIKQHERYLFPALIFVLLCYVFTDKITHFFGFLLMNLSLYLNVGHIFSLFKGSHWEGDMNSIVIKGFSALMLVMTGYMLVVYLFTYFDIRSVVGRILKNVRKNQKFVCVEQGSLPEDSKA